MTVNELITQLDLLPADAPVVFNSHEINSAHISDDGERVVLSTLKYG